MSDSQSAGAPTSESQRRLLERYVRRRKAASSGAAPSVVPRPAGAVVPLSFEQELIFVHALFIPELPLYNEVLTVRRKGPLDVRALERSLTEVVRRHEAWRTTFDVVGDQAVQIAHEAPEFKLRVRDLSSRGEGEREEEACRLATEEARAPLDPTHGPLVRAMLVRMAEEDHRLYVVVHQIIHDGISVYGVFLPELVALYEAFAAGNESPLAELAVQYADYAFAQRRAAADAPAASLAYWKKQLAGAPNSLPLPTDRARPREQTFRSGLHTFTVPKDVADAMKRLAAREQVTLYVAMLAAFKVLLHRHSGEEDIVVGSAVSTRRHAEVENLLGTFVNTIVLRTRLNASASFRDVLSRVRQVTVEGLAHADVPLHVLIRELHLKRDPGRHPLFQVMFGLEPPMPAPKPGWDMTLMDVCTGAAPFDFWVQMDDRADGMVGHVRFNPDLWNRATVVRLVEDFTLLLATAATNPEAPIAANPTTAVRDEPLPLMPVA
jgi:hypothetical protein